MLDLDGVYTLRNADYGLFSAFKRRGEGRFDIGLFLKNKGREEGYDFGGREVGEDILQDQFCED